MSAMSRCVIARLWFRLRCVVLGHRLPKWDPATRYGHQRFSYRMGVCLRCGAVTYPNGDRL